MYMLDTNTLNIANSSNGTSLTSDLIGYSCLIISSVFYGGNNLPVKYYETGDGMFFQLIVAFSIWTTGIIVHAVQGFPQFYAYPLLGGFFWTCGNCCTVPVIKCLGIGVGSLFWNIVGLIFGWAYARFGWFGITPEIPTKTWLNYLAIGLAILSTIVLVFVKTVENQVLLNKKEKKKEGELVDVEELDIFDKSHLYFKQKFNINWFKHALGTFLSIFAGVCYALCYEPQLYVMNTVPGASQDNNDYAFSLSCGIMLSSLLFYIAYSIFYKVALKKTPQIYPEIILPCFVIGWLWGVANTAYFVSTNKLSQAISFPIANSGPSIVAFIIGLCYKEIKGFWNLTILYIGLALSIVSVILCGLSK